jgi:cell division initiation protein
MKITPLDIQQQRFRVRFRGYDTKEVDTFLELLANELAESAREANMLHDELRLKEQELAEYRDREKSIQETLHVAQKIREDMQETAKREAQLTLRHAQQEAEKLLMSGHVRLTKLLEEITALKAQRLHLEEEIRASAERHLKLVEMVRESRQPEVQEIEDKLRLFRKAVPEAAGKSS